MIDTIQIVLYSLSLLLLLILFSVSIGFSPMLYSMMFSFRQLDKQSKRRLDASLLAGILLGIIAMFVVGSSLVLLVESILSLFDTESQIRYLGIITAGGALIILSLTKLRQPSHQPKPSKARKKSGNAALVFTVGFSRTVTRVSGLATVALVSLAISSRDIIWPISYFAIGPLILLSATAPYLFIAHNSRALDILQKKLEIISIRLIDTLSRNHKIIRLLIGILGCSLVSYGVVKLIII